MKSARAADAAWKSVPSALVCPVFSRNAFMAPGDNQEGDRFSPDCSHTPDGILVRKQQGLHSMSKAAMGLHSMCKAAVQQPYR